MTPTKKTVSNWAVTAVVLLMTVSSAASANPAASCEEAEEHAATLKTWPALYSAFERYGRCDDGSIAEGFDESVYNLLGKLNASELKLASVLFTKSHTFQDFTLRHVRSATVLREQYDKAVNRLAIVCSRQRTQTCDSLVDAARSAEGVPD